jgi:AcrR family transcriptional regulator
MAKKPGRRAQLGIGGEYKDGGTWFVTAPVDRRLLRTRSVLRTALLALLERKQFDEITIRDITAEASIGYATFFRHYSSKSALLKAVAQEQIGNLLEMAIPLLVAQDIRGSCLSLCKYMSEHRAMWSALLTGGAAGLIRQEFMRQSMKRGTAAMPPSTWVPAELGVNFGVAATLEIFDWWLRKPNAFSVDEVAEVLDRLVVSPISVAWSSQRTR